MAIEPIEDHAERAVALLPAQHERESWRKLARALLGLRGSWADGVILWAVRTSKGTIVLPQSELATYFGGGGAATIIGGANVPFALGDRTLRVSTISAPAFVVTPETVDAAVEAQTVRSILHDNFPVQVSAEVEPALAGAPWGLQELEEVFFQLTGLRRLSVAAGAQLDALGDLLRHPRDGRNDGLYRRGLQLARRANATKATIPEVIDAAAEQFGVVFVQVLEGIEAYFSTYLHGTALDAPRRRLLRGMHAAGVGHDVISSGGELPFVLGPEAGWNTANAVAANLYTLDGDVSALYAIGDEVRVWSVAAEAVLHSTTVTSVTFVGPDTDIGVAADGGVVAPFVLENVTRGIQDEDGGPFEDAYLIVGFTGLATFRVDNDATSEFVGGGIGVGHAIEVVGSTGDDGFYRVTAVSFALGETSLTVTPLPPAGAGDGHLQHAAPEWAGLNAARSTHGEFSDAFVD